MQRTLAIDGLANVRDLGGLERSDGSTTPLGVFVRAERLDRVTAQGWQSLQDHGVRTVIDLRRPEERSGQVPGDIRRIEIDLDGDDRTFWAPMEADGRWCTPLYYEPHLEQMPDRLAEVLQAIATAEDGAILFHCSAGWDRTGLVTAALLRAVGTTTTAAMDDYLMSYANAEAMSALHERPSEAQARRDVVARFGSTPEAVFREFYQSLDLPVLFDSAGVALATRLAISTWRGAVEPPAASPLRL